MFFGEEDSPFQDLPPEMIVEVLSQVDLMGKQSARLVCRRWRWILDHPDAGLVSFKLINEELTEDSIQCLLKSQLHIDHIELDTVKATWPVMTFSRNKFPPIQKLTLRSGNSDKSLTTILQYGCAQTVSLTLDYDCLNHFRLDTLSRVLSGMKWNHMTELNLKIIPRGNRRRISEENNDKGIELILKKARIPNLRVLSLDLLLIGDYRLTGVPKVMSNFIIFLERHTKTLKELNLCFYSNREILIFPNISAPLYSAEQQASVARDLKLESLDIMTTHFDALLYLVPPCIWKSNDLTKLKWRPWHQLRSMLGPNWIPNPTSKPRLIAPPGTAKPMQSLVQQNRNSLTHVTTSFIHGDIDVDPFELSWLESCPLLRELTITNCDKFLGVKLQLPTVRKLHIDHIDNIENMSTWISRTFRNLKTVQISFRFTTALQNLQFDWIQNLLILPRLEEIRFRFTYCWFQDSYYQPIGPNLIRQYCSDKARLMFRVERQRRQEYPFLRCDPCLIKILSIQN